jgi:hypothetical protein
MMVRFYVDNDLPLHPVVQEAGNAAMGVWVRAGAWTAKHNTNGFIPAHIARKIGTGPQLRRLVEAGLFRKTAKGYRFRGWDGKSPTGPSTRPKLAVINRKGSDPGA